MKTLMLFMVLLFASSCVGQEQYEVKHFNCYLVGLYGVFDGDKMISQSSYGFGAVEDLQKMTKKWNNYGKTKNDEKQLQLLLRRKNLDEAIIKKLYK